MSATGPATPAAPPPRRPRFYRRKRFWWGSALTIAGLGLLALIAVYWLLQTVAGRDVLLAQVVARLPAGSSLTWERAEGPLAGPLTLYNLDFRYEEIHFTAERAYLDPDIRPLLGRKLQLDVLQLKNATLNLAKSEEPFELPSWPQSLPQIEVPLALQADHITIDGLRITQAQQPMIDIRTLRGGIEVANGEFRSKQLVVTSDRGDFRVDGDYVPAQDYKADLTASAVLPAARGRTLARLGLVARGNLDKMEVAIAGNAPAPLRATLVFTGRTDPTWQFAASSKALDPSLFVPPGDAAADAGEPIAFDLSASGKGGDAKLQGQLAYGAQKLTLDPSNVRLDNQVLTVAPLQLRAFDGQARLRGTADFRDPDNATFRFSVNASGLKFATTPDPSTPDAPAVPIQLVEANLGLAGTLKQWATYGEATVARGKDSAGLQLDVRGDDRQAQIVQLQAAMPTGTLDLGGAVAWAPELSWDLSGKLAGFDPGYFAPGWDGNLSGQFASKGKQLPLRPDGSAAGYQASLDVPHLNGKLRSRPLDANGKFALQGEQGEGKLQLALGDSRVQAQGKVGDQLDIDAQLQPLQLADLLPGATGSLRGSVQVKGRRDAPDLTADLTGNSLKWDSYGADSVTLRGRLPWRGSGGELALRGSAINAGMVLQTLRVDARGAVENLQLDADTQNDMGTLALAGQLRRDGARWQGGVNTLRVAPAKGEPWQLRQPATFAIAGSAFTLSDTCLGATGGGALCVAANWPKQGLTVRGDALPLSLVQPWLPPNSGRKIYLRGELTLDGSFKPAGNAWQGSLRLASPEGGLRLGDNARGELVRYDQFSFVTDFTAQHIHSKLGVGFKGDGFIDATVDTGWDAYAPLTGEIYMNMSRLYWMELFSPDLVRPKGLVEGHVSLRGTRSQPSMGGNATLSNFTGELPALGLTLSEGNGRFDAQPDGSARIVAAVKSGEGTLNVDGGLSWYGDTTPLQLNIRGSNVLVSNTAELRAVANPDLQFGIANKTMKLNGQVTVPSADIDLERLDRGTSVSEDVVVLDPADPEEAPSSPLEMDLRVVLGDQVKMAGFGLKGALTGTMQVRSRQGREMTATGGLDVSGQYKAYGQDLTISRGQLTWSNNVVSDPRINMRAQRKIGDVTAGIDVTGRATAPRADVWSDPSMSQSEAMSYLVLGRSLSNASSDEADQVTAAASALSAGSGILASQLGARLGFDDAGVSQSRALGGSVVGFGKYLSPRLYVSYGVSLVGSGSVLTLKYLLGRGFDAEVESSTVENRGSINWRKEK
ncbi:translocation/assembly module TamB domain-containing protein [Xanthomonas sp. NCPPB 2654]|uniref:translocation/assembly module TamB domain-containing protein n=1 Tax=unclassified Xanthomonas TaxID=2643310 RepID=UPI0021DF7E10|nr:MULTISPECIES: translocation/assembly module TamB domain-containing protein [unclassified Xanthomonas]MDL5364123.1 translocation/assembly module TamB domain-containing protein [Xanthomonas sp. NCPPB 2654]UYC20882.1 translocation/assembly module TamB [Xanthomonas sp. CFBP 8443]